MKTEKARLTRYDNGKIVVEPYVHSTAHRYSPLLELEHGSLTSTQEHYRLLLLLPRKDNLMDSVRHLMADVNRVVGYFMNLFVSGSDDHE